MKIVANKLSLSATIEKTLIYGINVKNRTTFNIGL